MRAPHLLRVEGGPERFAPLFAAAAAAGLRTGWLDLAEPAAGPPGAPAELEAAAAVGALRAVAVGGGRSVALKPLHGAAVLEDLLRQHFLGCALVLVHAAGEAAAVPRGGLPPLPLLRPAQAVEEGWEVHATGAAMRLQTTGELVASLRRPHPWRARERSAGPVREGAPAPREKARQRTRGRSKKRR